MQAQPMKAANKTRRTAEEMELLNKRRFKGEDRKASRRNKATACNLFN